MWKKFWCQFVMSHFMTLSKLEKNLSKWNEDCNNNWDKTNGQKSDIDKTFDKIESILDKAWKHHIKKHIKCGLEIPYDFEIEENEYDITSKDIHVFKHLGKTVSFKNQKYQVCFASNDGNLFDKRLRVSVTI